MTGVLLPEEVMNKAEYKAMRQAFDSLPLAKQGEAVRQIVAAWSLAYQDFPVNLKKDMGRVTERVVDAVNLALILNQISSGMSASQKDVDAANRIINETVKAINDVNLKIAEKKKQQVPLLSLMKQKQKEVEELKKYLRTILITVFVMLREHMMMPGTKMIYWSVILMRCRHRFPD